MNVLTILRTDPFPGLLDLIPRIDKLPSVFP
jgi:hypothetical protein